MKKNKLIDKAFELIDIHGWSGFSLLILAKEEKLTVTEIKIFFDSKRSLLTEFSKMIDKRVESKIDLEDLHVSAPKDNLFELIMMRFEEMESYKKPLKKILTSKKIKTIDLTIISRNILNSLDFYMELSNAYSKSHVDLLKKKGLFLIYSLSFRVWLNDKTEDLSKTMSQLDKLLTLAEKISKKLTNFPIF